MGIAYLCMQLRIHHNDMKKHLILLCVLAFSASLHVVAQSIRKQIESHPELSANNYLAYPAPSGKLTPAPSGYLPVYLSHYGRHLNNFRKLENIPISGKDVLLIHQIAFYDDPTRFVTMVNKLCDELDNRKKQNVSVFKKGTKRILLTGTPLSIPNWKIHHIIETTGGAVVCEEMCTGIRYCEALVDETGTTIDEMVNNLTKRYLGHINCACFTPNKERIDDIIRLAKEYKADGVIDLNLKFCNIYDTEGYFVEKVLREHNIPCLGIETDYTDEDAEQLKTRIGAFIEMLR